MDIEISTSAVKEMLEREPDTLVLLDCRTEDEWKQGHIPGAVHIPLADLPSRSNDLDPDKKIIVYCHHGQRSFNAALFLRGQDFLEVTSLAGGIDAWAREVDDSIPRY